MLMIILVHTADDRENRLLQEAYPAVGRMVSLLIKHLPMRGRGQDR